MSGESKAGGVTNDYDVFESPMETSTKGSPGQQKDNVLQGSMGGSYSFAFIRYLWLLFHGAVKAYHNLEVVFTLRRMIVLLDCVLQHHTRSSCTKCSPWVCCNF